MLVQHDEKTCCVFRTVMRRCFPYGGTIKFRENNSKLFCGIYFYRLTVEDFFKLKKMTLMKREDFAFRRAA
jgi:hypothetical protein